MKVYHEPDPVPSEVSDWELAETPLQLVFICLLCLTGIVYLLIAEREAFKPNVKW